MTPDWVKKIVAKMPVAGQAMQARNQLIGGLGGNTARPANPLADPTARKNYNPNPLGTPIYTPPKK